MGLSDHILELEDVAMAAALEAKAVEYCPVHGDVWIRLGDDDAERLAYAIATNRWKSGAIVCDREDLVAAVEDVLGQAADVECSECDEIADA